MFCDSFTTMSTDATLICIDCGGIFPFTAKDQDYFRGHNYSTPIRCKACRLKWRQQRAAPESGCTNQQPAAQPKARGGSRVTCSACGQEADVPFEPRPDRPVYCRSCYNARKARQAS